VSALECILCELRNQLCRPTGYKFHCSVANGGIFPQFLEIWGISNSMGNGEFPGELIENWGIPWEFKIADIFYKLCLKTMKLS